jgi:hypothetical protein
VWTEVGPFRGIADEFAEDRRGAIQLSGNEQNHEIAATLAQAWDDGFDAVMLKNFTSPGGRTGTILVVKDGVLAGDDGASTIRMVWSGRGDGVADQQPQPDDAAGL